MEHITNIDDGLTHTLIVAAAAAFVLALVSVAAALFVSRRWAVAAACGFALIGTVIGAAAMQEQQGTLRQRIEAIQHAVFKEYGIALGDDEVIQLHWPVERPDKPGHFGETKLVINGDMVVVSLVWDGHEFALAAKPSPDRPPELLPKA